MAFIPSEWTLDGGARFDGNELVIEASGSARKTFALNQKTAMPVRIVCESRAENADGNCAYEYSVLAKVVFEDGTTNRLQWTPFNDGSLFYTDYAAFPNGTHDWTERSFLLIYEKPVREAEINLLFLKHTGSARFRCPAVRDFAQENTLLFDTFPVHCAPPPGFFLRDARTKEFRPVAEISGLKMDFARREEADGTVRCTASLTSETQSDLVFTAYFTQDLPGGDIAYLPEIDREVPAEGGRDYFQVATWRGGINGLVSKVPFAAVSVRGEGFALTFDPESPAFGRVGCNASFRNLFIAFDVALTKEHPRAELHFCFFRFDPAHGYRSALEKYYLLFPASYETRIREQGNWMPFVRISTLPHPEDFHFRFNETNERDSEPEWDRAHGVLTFRYTEPMTCWMGIPRDQPLTHDSVVACRRRMQKEGTPGEARLARMIEESVMYDEDGRDVLIAMDRPWCYGGVWSINSMPGIPGDCTDFKSKWNDGVKERLYVPGSVNEFSGEYFDSSEGYVTADLDFRRGHFAGAELPLTFSTDTAVPGIWKGAVVYEKIRAIRKELVPLGKYTMANGTPGIMWFLPAVLDVCGTETDWCPDGVWEPVGVEEFHYRRAAIAGKPFCFLMNTDFTRFTSEMVEKYMRRSLVFGFFPGFFSADAATGHYFANPALYERDRPLFKKYLPLIKKVAEAGWKPVPAAEISGGERLTLEQYGAHLFTVLNDSQETVRAVIRFDGPERKAVTDLLTGAEYTVAGGRIELELPPDGVALLETR